MIIRWGYPYADTRVVTVETVILGQRRGVSAMVYTSWKKRRNRHKRKQLAAIIWGMRKQLRHEAKLAALPKMTQETWAEIGSGPH